MSKTKSVYVLKMLILALLTAMYLPSLANSQSPNFKVTSSPNVVGSGARALGVGGAFMAIADDATAASWNPAALIILEKPEAAIMGSFDDRSSGVGETSFYDFNYIALSYPFSLFDRNMIISLNYQRLFDFNSEFKKELAKDSPVIRERSAFCNTGFVDGDSDTFPESCLGVAAADHPFGWDIYTIDFTTRGMERNDVSSKTRGDIGAIAPAFAIQVTPKISFGLTTNFWMDGVVNDGYSNIYKEQQKGTYSIDTDIWEDRNTNGVIDGVWDEANDANGIPEVGEGEYIDFPGTAQRTFTLDLETEETFNFRGTNFNLGLLFSLPKDFSLAVVYKTPFTAVANRKRKLHSVQTTFDTLSGDLETIENVSRTDDKLVFHFPAVYGIGAAKRFGDKFTLAADVSYTEWDKFTVKTLSKTGGEVQSGFRLAPDLQTEGKEFSPVNGLRIEDADIDPVFTARMGAEYRFITQKTIVPVRAGVFYDPEPARSKPNKFYGGSFGTGVVLFKRVLIDIAYVYRFGPDAVVSTVVKEDLPARLGHFTIVREVKEDVTQHQVLLSSIVHF